MEPIVISWCCRCAKSNKLPVELLPLAAADAASHLKSSDLHLPMGEAARIIITAELWGCWELEGT